eukprot:c20403_g1_i1.p1 GENE.c20403_g1_i1~~c20403_g1_i1.p1  ORF type:complete len:192 (+),score=75.21 c20403_g1_i1:269-844(+)
MMGVPGISEKLFGALRKVHISVIFITQASSEHSICFAVPMSQARLAKTVVEEAFAREIKDKTIDGVLVENDCTIVAIVGEGMKHTPGIAARLFAAIGAANVNIMAIAQGCSELNVSIVMKTADSRAAMNALHKACFTKSEQSPAPEQPQSQAPTQTQAQTPAINSASAMNSSSTNINDNSNCDSNNNDNKQ